MKLCSKNQHIIVKDINNIIKTINAEANYDNWKGWEWQIKHSIRDK